MKAKNRAFSILSENSTFINKKMNMLRISFSIFIWKNNRKDLKEMSWLTQHWKSLIYIQIMSTYSKMASLNALSLSFYQLTTILLAIHFMKEVGSKSSLTIFTIQRNYSASSCTGVLLMRKFKRICPENHLSL